MFYSIRSYCISYHVFFRYSEAVDDFAKQSNIQADFQVAPNRHSIAARLSLVWANADLDMIISLVDTCALQLELAAAWNLPIFTAVSVFNSVLLHHLL